MYCFKKEIIDWVYSNYLRKLQIWFLLLQDYTDSLKQKNTALIKSW